MPTLACSLSSSGAPTITLKNKRILFYDTANWAKWVKRLGTISSLKFILGLYVQCSGLFYSILSHFVWFKYWENSSNSHALFWGYFCPAFDEYAESKLQQNSTYTAYIDLGILVHKWGWSCVLFAGKLPPFPIQFPSNDILTQSCFLFLSIVCVRKIKADFTHKW